MKKMIKFLLSLNIPDFIMAVKNFRLLLNAPNQKNEYKQNQNSPSLTFSQQGHDSFWHACKDRAEKSDIRVESIVLLFP